MRPTGLGPAITRPRLPFRLMTLVACVLGLTACGLGGSQHARAVPSAVVHYAPDLPASLDQYAAPGNVIVVTAEQRNRNPARIRAWRAKGANVFAYVNLVDWRAPLDPIEKDLYGGSFPSAWYLGSYSNYPGTRLTNLEDTCPVATYNGFTGTWGQYAARWIRNSVIQDGSLFNGVFLDVWGDQLYNVPVGGPGTHWDAGVAKWGQEIRAQVGPNIFLVGNNTQSHATAAALNGRMWESFESRRSGYNDLTGQGTHPGLLTVFPWPEWRKPRMDILWRNEASPAQDTKDMLVAAAQRVTVTGAGVAVGSSDHQGHFPAPFGGGGGSTPPASTVPAAPRTTTTTPTTTATRSATTTTRATATASGGGATGGSGSSSGSGSGAGPGAGPVTVIAGAAPLTGRRLLFTEFQHGKAGSPWRRVRSPSATVVLSGNAAGGKAALVTAARAGAFATLSAAVPGHAATTTAVRLRVPKIALPAGAARALVSLGGASGASREVGVVRARGGGLRWGAWIRDAAGAVSGLKVSTRALPLQTWVTVRVTTDWAGTGGRDAVKVGRDRVLRVGAGALAGDVVSRVTVGLGAASTAAEAAGVLVRAIAVVART